MVDGKADAVRHRVAGGDGLAEAGQIFRQLLRRQGAGIVRGDSDELHRVIRHTAVHAVVILVAQYTGQHRQGTVRQIIRDILGQRLNTLGIVAAVNEEQRVAADDLEPARPRDAGQPLTDILLGDVPAPLLQHVQRGQRHGGIVELMLAQQGEMEIFPAAEVEDLPLQRMLPQVQLGKVHLVERCAHLAAALLHHGFHAVGGAVQHRVAAGLDDAALGGGDLLQCVAQHLRVVKADVAQHGSLGSADDVGGVELAAHAYLAHHDVAPAAGKPREGNGRDHLKLGGLLENAVGQRLDLLGDGAQLVVGDLLAVDLHPLVEADDVGRGVQAGAIARLPQHRGHHGAGGALAVGAGDVNKFQRPLRMTHLVQQGADTLQTGDAALPADGVDVM